MVVVADANVIISGLIKPDGKVGSLLFSDNGLEKICPYFLVVEVFEHKDKIIKASGLEEAVFIELYYLLITQLILVKESDIPLGIWAEANRLVRDKDLGDVAYVALSLYFDAHLWSGDKVLISHLNSKGFDKTFHTNELYQLFNS